MNPDFLRKQKFFHENPYVNPINGKRLIFGSKEYLRSVKIYGLPDLSYLLNQISIDILNEIFKYIDNKTLTSFLLVNHYINQFISHYKDNIFEYALERELNYTNNIKIGARMTDRKHNYKLIKIGKNDMNVTRVDLLGHQLNEKVYSVNISYHKSTGKFISYLSGNELNLGIIVCKNGPKIKNINDPMLKYKIIDNAKVGSSVLMIKKQYKYFNYYECIVKEINDDTMKLGYLNDVRDCILTAHYINGKWVCDIKNIKIARFYNGIKLKNDF